MSLRQTLNTEHSYKRAKERFGLNKSLTKAMIQNANKYGIGGANLGLGPLRDYLLSKGKNKRIKLYNNYVFVFCKNSTRCITVYQVPEEILEAQKEYDKENRKPR